MRSLLLCASILFLAPRSHASEEEFLPWTEIRLTLGGNDQTGKLLFTASAREDKFKEIRIDAFGKQHNIPKEMLAKLTGFPLTSLATSHEAGFERLGGHMVHFKFKKVHVDKNRGAIETRIVLSVTKNKGPVLSEPRENVLKAEAPAAGHFCLVEARGVLEVSVDQTGHITSARLTIHPQDGAARKSWPLDLPDDDVRKLARSLNGQSVLVTGDLMPPVEKKSTLESKALELRIVEFSGLGSDLKGMQGGFTFVPIEPAPPGALIVRSLRAGS